jgi:hypothetical protein
MLVPVAFIFLCVLGSSAMAEPAESDQRCDEDKARFEAKLSKIARAIKPK